MKNNKGYTLIEMIIVIAIMAVLSGMAFFTTGIIRKAKCNAAVDTFNNHLSSLWIKTKSISQGKQQTSPTGTSDAAKYPLCMKLEKNSDSSDDIKDDSYVLYLCYDRGSSGDVVEREQITVLPHFVGIEYTPSKSNQVNSHNSGNDKIIIEFNKSDGSVIYGAGTYSFIFDGKSYADIILDGVSGNHYTK